MKKTIRISESALREAIEKTLKENYMSDDEIINQYSNMEVISFKMTPLRYDEGWSGIFELKFPNADNIDYDEYMINNFIVYDREGNRIAWDNWMPDEQTHILEKTIRDEISKRIKKNDNKTLNEDKRFKFNEGDNVIVHTKDGDINGIISNYDYSATTFKKEYEVDFDNGKSMFGIPEDAIELISKGDTETRKKMENSNKLIAQMEEGKLNEYYVNQKIMKSFTDPKYPTRVVNNGPYKDFELLSAKEISKGNIKMNMKKLPKGYNGECYVVFLDDFLSFSGLGSFNPKGEGTVHYTVVKCKTPNEAKTIVKNGTKDTMRLIGICTEMPQFSKEVSYSIKDSENCPAWLNETIKKAVKKVLKENESIYNLEDLCKLFGCSFRHENDAARDKIECALHYLKEFNVIEGYNLDKLDWLFSDNQSY